MADAAAKGLRGAFLSMLRFFVKRVLVLLFILYVLTGFYSVPEDAAGVVRSFGKVIDGRVEPGLHYALPRPIDSVDKVPVMLIKSILIDDFCQYYQLDGPAALFKEETGLRPYCISGDNNIVSISLVIKYNIADPVAYLFTVKSSEEVLRDVASSTVLHCLAILPVGEILTYGKRNMENYVKTRAQEKLDSLQTGLAVSFIELKEVDPPESVQKYFDDVINAKIDRTKTINRAESNRNMKIPRAKAEAETMVQEAEAYKKEKISYAEGEAKRFLAQLAEYKKSKKITRERLYLEFIRSTYPSLKSIIAVDGKKDKRLIDMKLFSK